MMALNSMVQEMSGISHLAGETWIISGDKNG